MNKRHESVLADLKARQLAGEHMPCPRCGSFTMKPDLHTNALSRHADIYVCDGCGTEEALLARAGVTQQMLDRGAKAIMEKF